MQANAVPSVCLDDSRTCEENKNAAPWPAHWEKFVDAWLKSNYHTYFWNSAIVVVCAVAGVTIIGAMAAHCLARYNFRGSRLMRFMIVSGLILPPQLLILALFQILLDIDLYNTRTGLIVVYVATHIAVTVYILDTRLRADGLTVTVFKQTKGPDGQWMEAPTSAQTATDFENAILTRARQLRLSNIR